MQETIIHIYLNDLPLFTHLAPHIAQCIKNEFGCMVGASSNNVLVNEAMLANSAEKSQLLHVQTWNLVKKFCLIFV